MNPYDPIARKIASLQSFLPKEVSRIRAALKETVGGDFLKASEEYERQRNKFISKYRQTPLGSETFLAVLRRWNSYTPSLPNPDHKHPGLSQYSVGGGYFLFLQSPEDSLVPGYGLVIDPGYNFIHNFGAAGFALDDIDGILLTHAHNDHTNDFESLLSLLYQRNHRDMRKKAPKTVDLLLNVGSFKKFSNYLDLGRRDALDHVGNVIVMSPFQEHHIPHRSDMECSILTLQTKHHEIVTADYALGFCVQIGGRTILFSGDTGWDFQMAARNENFLKRHGVFTREEAEKGNVDLLVAHIGTVTRNECTVSETTPITDVFYSKHLGLLGTIAIGEQWKPRTCIISEFGEELTETRLEIVKQLEESLQKIHSDIRCIPADIGLFVFLDSRKALCYCQEKLVDLEALTYQEATRDGVRAIKYYSKESVANLSEEVTRQLIEDIVIAHGIHHHRAVASEGKDRATLVAALSRLRWDDDPWSMEEFDSEVARYLRLLSAILNDPSDLIALLKTSPHLAGIPSVLDGYYVNEETTRILHDLAWACILKGFGRAEQSASEKAIAVCFAGIPATIVDACLSGNFKEADEKLSQFKNLGAADVLGNISENERLHILFENRNEIENLKLNDCETAALADFAKYVALVEPIDSKLQSIIDRDSPDRCWQARSAGLPPGIIEDGLRKSLASGKSTCSKEELETALEICSQLIAIRKGADEHGASGRRLLAELGVVIDETMGPRETLFFVSYHLRKLNTNGTEDQRVGVLLSAIDDFLKAG